MVLGLIKALFSVRALMELVRHTLEVTSATVDFGTGQRHVKKMLIPYRKELPNRIQVTYHDGDDDAIDAA